MVNGASEPRHAWRHELANKSIVHKYVGEEPEQDAVRALCIGGGGIRGLLPAMVAAELERRTGQATADLFDFIVGTSTGSIVALGASTVGPDGRPKWTAEDGVAIYENRGHEIFARPRFSVGAFHEKVPPRVVRAAARRAVGRHHAVRGGRRLPGHLIRADPPHRAPLRQPGSSQGPGLRLPDENGDPGGDGGAHLLRAGPRDDQRAASLADRRCDLRQQPGDDRLHRGAAHRLPPT